MRKRVLQGFAVMLLTAAFSVQAASGPKIEVMQERYAMGSIVQGIPAEHVFEVRNAGDAPLVIERLQPT